MRVLGADSFTLIGKRGNLYEVFGGIAFRDGRVTWLQREWLLKDSSDDITTTLRIFHAALSSVLGGKAESLCTVSVQSQLGAWDQDKSSNSGVIQTTNIECPRMNYTHSLLLTYTDCSSGCSTGTFSPSVEESVKQNGP